MTTQIADWLESELEPQGVGVVLEAEHLCMTVRGVRKPGARTITSSVRGMLRRDPRTRAEFLTLVRGTGVDRTDVPEKQRPRRATCTVYGVAVSCLVPGTSRTRIPSELVTRRTTLLAIAATAVIGVVLRLHFLRRAAEHRRGRVRGDRAAVARGL